MPALSNVTYVTVTGKYVDTGNGTPLRGKVRFTPNVTRMVDEGADAIIAPTPVTVTLNDQGEFSVNLQATDDPDVSPTGWTYTVTEDLRGQGAGSTARSTFGIALPRSLAPGPISIADLDTTTPVFTEAGEYVRSVNGASGVVTLTLAGLGAGNSATRNVGTTAGTVAAGDDARLASFTVPAAGQVATPGGLRADRITAGAASQNARKLYVEDPAGTTEAALVKSTAVGTAGVPAAAVEVSGTTKRIAEMRVTGDTAARIIFDIESGNGRIQLGDGSTVDVKLTRSAVETLKLDGSLVILDRLNVGGTDGFAEQNTITANTEGTDAAVYARATDVGNGSVGVIVIEISDTAKRGLDFRKNGDDTSRLRIDASKGSGTLTFGDGDDADTVLYRSAAGTLKTDGDLVVLGNITAASITVSGGSTGAATESAGFSFKGSDLTAGTLQLVAILPKACTVTAVKAFRVGGSGATINARNGSTNKLLATDLSIGTTGTPVSGAGLQNTSVAAGGFLQVELTGVSGGPTSVTVFVEYQVNP